MREWERQEKIEREKENKGKKEIEKRIVCEWVKQREREREQWNRRKEEKKEEWDEKKKRGKDWERERRERGT